MYLNLTIESAEKKYKQILEEYFISVYNDPALSSHGIEHHRRVWKYSVELLNLLPVQNKNTSQFADELIIASYLHDIGMSVDPGIKHGKHSSDLCVNFLSKNKLDENDFPHLLEAIENHDNKDYPENKDSSELLNILSIADDLDAFGVIGIYRYSEIYLTRGINVGKIGNMIRDNAGKRFNNLAPTLKPFPEYFQKHHERYNILDEFFRKYNEELPSYHFYTVNPKGYCGVIQLFANMISDKMQLSEIYNKVIPGTIDPVIKMFFGELRNELTSESQSDMPPLYLLPPAP
jgi:HD superfamily phosphodiesterase